MKKRCRHLDKVVEESAATIKALRGQLNWRATRKNGSSKTSGLVGDLNMAQPQSLGARRDRLYLLTRF
jgi:hypothetical protein